MGTQCNDIETLLPTYLDGELAPNDRFSFEHHVADCADCREHVRAERAYQGRLRELLAPPPAPDDLGPRIREALDREEVHVRAARRQIGRTWALPAAASLAAAAALVLLALSEVGSLPAPHGGEHQAAQRAASRGMPLGIPIASRAGGPAAVRDAERGVWRARDARFEVVLPGGRPRWVSYQEIVCRDIDLASHQRATVGGAEIWVANWPVSNLIEKIGNGRCAVFSSDMDMRELVDEVAHAGLIGR